MNIALRTCTNLQNILTLRSPIRTHNASTARSQLSVEETKTSSAFANSALFVRQHYFQILAISTQIPYPSNSMTETTHPSGLSSEQIADLLAQAEKAAANSYSPYSHFRVGAAVLLKSDVPVSPEELRDFAAAKLAAYKVPANIWVADEPFPRSGAGKTLKREIQAACLARAAQQ